MQSLQPRRATRHVSAKSSPYALRAEHCGGLWRRLLNFFDLGHYAYPPRTEGRAGFIQAAPREAGLGVARDLAHIPIEYLLGRPEIPADLSQSRKVVTGRSVLITGAGGSIGSELSRQLAGANPRKLLLLDKSENGLFYAHLKASGPLGPARTKPLLADLTRRDALCEIMRHERPEIVFHAAAHKHVSLLESHPHEAIRNNVLGTRNVAEAALECGAEIFINISTDKAVKPLSYMGLSKRITELCVQELAREFGVRFASVRFGNVAGSTGSVIPLFRDQIERGGPVRVSDSRAMRYFMSPREAAHLILRAAALADGGETFVMEMGEPVNILDLARKLIRSAGFQPGHDMGIEFTGLKEGEKIAEQLWEFGECPRSAGADGILAIREESALSHGILHRVACMEQLLAADDRHALCAYLRQLFPDFKRGARQILQMPRAKAVAGRARIQAL